jgi:elongator complex protein 3
VALTTYTIRTQQYPASGGTEHFLSAESDDCLLGFLRLRYPPGRNAIIRELHVYGTASSIGGKGAIQHQGIGRKLLSKAEYQARKDGKTRIDIISGVGAREYYRKLGYHRRGPYMSKKMS